MVGEAHVSRGPASRELLAYVETNGPLLKGGKVKTLLMRHFCRCKESKCARGCFYCFIAYVSLPLEHGMWEWTGTARFLPLIGLHI